MKDFGQVERLFSYIDSIMSISILERFDDLKVIDSIDKGPFYFYQHPYEQSCKEHLSWFEKYINMVKIGEGLDFTLKNLGLKEGAKV
jgi:hypothetical protein